MKLTPDMVSALKDAGLSGFIFHVDRYQNRPGWIGKSESDINTLRQHLVDMVHAAGGRLCGFNITVVPETLPEVPDMVRWVTANIHKVHVILFIPVRSPHQDQPYEFYAGETKVEPSLLPFLRPHRYRNMSAAELYEQILAVLPQFRFNAYLAGTLRSDVPKWLFGNAIGTPDGICGTLGSKAMEIIQSMHHLLRKRYVAFLNPWQYRMAQLLFLLVPFDRETRKTAWRYVRGVLRHPRRVWERLSVQTIIVMQPQDVLENGEQDMCDGCPNKTYWNGRLVSECRLEEHIRFGRLLTMTKRTEQAIQQKGRISA